MRQRVLGAHRLEGQVSPPGDKSISHRAAILNAIARGTARVTNFSPGADCASTLRCLRALGVNIQDDPDEHSSLVVRGAAGAFREPDAVLNAGNSGTSMRLLSGLLAGQSFLSVLTGDHSLRSRPMGRILEPLRLMGAQVHGRMSDTLAPMVFRGGDLHGIEYRLPVASAQLKSCLLLAGLFAQGQTVVIEPAPSRDHTEKMLEAMGAPISVEDGVISVQAGPLTARDVRVPADISSAAFWLVAGAAHSNARLRITGVGVNPTRAGVLDALQTMGARIILEGRREEGGEAVADILVESSPLRATEVGGDLVPRLIDELPVLAVAACFAQGTTVIRDAAELRVKESDRIQAMVRELNRMGGQLQETPDGMIIHGPVRLRGAACRSYGDHRVAMSLAVAGLLAQGETTISGAQCATISYPGFWNQLEALTNGGSSVGE